MTEFKTPEVVFVAIQVCGSEAYQLSKNSANPTFEYSDSYRSMEKASTSKHVIFLFLLPILLIVPALSHTAEMDEELRAVTDDAEEGSNFLKKDWRIVPVPIPISNPTIGTGLAGAVLYLHPKKEENSDTPSTISGVVGGYTSTNSYFGVVFHDGSYSEDRYRFRGLFGGGVFNLKFYGIGDDPQLQDDPVEYEAKGAAFASRGLLRLPFKNWFAGAQYRFLKEQTKFEPSDLIPNAPEINAQSQTGGLGAVAVYDSRDNNLWSSRGTWLEVSANAHGSYFGGDFEYQKYIVKSTKYFPLWERAALGLRLDCQFNAGDVPFYDLAYVNLRGIPMTLYIDKQAVTVQGEARWNFYKRWIALIFGGVGRTGEHISDLGSSPNRYAGGVGFRFIVAEKQKLTVGVDLAVSPDDVTLYIQIGDFLAF